MKLFSALVVLCLFSAEFAFAGDVKRNGGDVLLCDGHYLSFDLYEGQSSYGYELNLPTGRTYQQIAESLISRMGVHNPGRQSLYLQFLQNFTQEARFVPSANFTAIPDIGDGVPVPKNCSLVQTIAQFRQHDLQGKKYLVNQDVWSLLSEPVKAALVLHEFIYREALSDNPSLQNSIGVRHFTAYLSSTMVRDDHFQDYIKAVAISGLQKAEYNGFTFLLQFPFEFSEDGRLAKATLGSRFLLPHSEQLVACSGMSSTDAIKLFVVGDTIEVRSTCLMIVPLQNGEITGSAPTRRIVLDKLTGLPVFLDFGNDEEFDSYRFDLSNRNFIINANPNSYGTISWDNSGHLRSVEIVFGGFSKSGLSDNIVSLEGKKLPITAKKGLLISERYLLSIGQQEQIHWSLKP